MNCFCNDKKEKIILKLSIIFLMLINFGLEAKAVEQKEVSRLIKGEIISKSLTHELKGGLRGAEAKIFIKAPPEQVWKVIDDHESLPTYVSRFKRVKIIEETPNSQKVEVAIKFCPVLPTFKYTILFDKTEKYKKVKFNKIGGCFKRLYGIYDLQPYQKGTLLTYKIFLDPGFYIPEFVRGNGVNKDLPEILESIRSRVEDG
jgi:ribosome-associated toxin RatA of RatAB toxin-antitoxin module